MPTKILLRIWSADVVAGRVKKFVPSFSVRVARISVSRFTFYHAVNITASEI